MKSSRMGRESGGRAGQGKTGQREHAAHLLKSSCLTHARSLVLDAPLATPGETKYSGVSGTGGTQPTGAHGTHGCQELRNISKIPCAGPRAQHGGQGAVRCVWRY